MFVWVLVPLFKNQTKHSRAKIKETLHFLWVGGGGGGGISFGTVPQIWHTPSLSPFLSPPPPTHRKLDGPSSSVGVINKSKIHQACQCLKSYFHIDEKIALMTELFSISKGAD